MTWKRWLAFRVSLGPKTCPCYCGAAGFGAAVIGAAAGWLMWCAEALARWRLTCLLCLICLRCDPPEVGAGALAAGAADWSACAKAGSGSKAARGGKAIAAQIAIEASFLCMFVPSNSHFCPRIIARMT